VKRLLIQKKKRIEWSQITYVEIGKFKGCPIRVWLNKNESEEMIERKKEIAKLVTKKYLTDERIREIEKGEEEFFDNWYDDEDESDTKSPKDLKKYRVLDGISVRVYDDKCTFDVWFNSSHYNDKYFGNHSMVNTVRVELKDDKPYKLIETDVNLEG
jgi:hypothetical protein